MKAPLRRGFLLAGWLVDRATCPERAPKPTLVDVLAADGTPVPELVANAKDPFDVLRYAGTISTELAQRIEAQLRASEIEATRTATATAHATEVISAWRDAGLRLTSRHTSRL
jgi:hypothetical protein